MVPWIFDAGTDGYLYVLYVFHLIVSGQGRMPYYMDQHDAECHTIWISMMLNVIPYGSVWCWLSYHMDQYDAECHTIWISMMLNVIPCGSVWCWMSYHMDQYDAEFHTIWISMMLNVIPYGSAWCWMSYHVDQCLPYWMTLTPLQSTPSNVLLLMEDCKCNYNSSGVESVLRNSSPTIWQVFPLLQLFKERGIYFPRNNYRRKRKN